MTQMVPLHMEIRPLPSAELENVIEMIRAAKQDLGKVTGVDVAYLADVAHDFPVLFSADYQNRFPGL